MSKFRKTGTLLLTAVMALSMFSFAGGLPVQADTLSSGQINGVKDVTVNGNVAMITFSTDQNVDIQGKITFLEDGIFRYNVDPTGDFSNYPAYRNGYPTGARIVAQSDNSDRYSKPEVTVDNTANANKFVITTTGEDASTSIEFDKTTGLMTVKNGDKTVMQESAALTFTGTQTVQTLAQSTSGSNSSSAVAEQFYGGGTQNGRLVHTGETINIANESVWVDGGVSSPNPFYYTTNGYGVLRNTWMNGSYDFGDTAEGKVTTTHQENEYDAYIFVADVTSSGINGSTVAQQLLDEYYTVTGNPVLLPEYGFYLGHLNAYNRDAWSDTGSGTGWVIKGNEAYNESDKSKFDISYEQGATGYEIKENQEAETLNGWGPTLKRENVPSGVTYSYKWSARAVLDEYQKYDMPIGFFLPNDGYGAGYGQNGYQVTGGVTNGVSSQERLDTVAANVENLRSFATYASNRGVATGLWTQSQLEPDANSNTYWHILRDFESEVAAGVTTLKTDVAWVGPGYSFQLSGVKTSYDIVTTSNGDGTGTRPNIISLDGWAGSQRYNSVWTGDQTGGNWEYIRFHIPTFIGQSLSGNPNIGSDMDGIWGGSPIIATRDYQWKSFAPQMLDMDGWGSYAKGPYVHGDPYTGVSRMYLKLKAQLMPYIYTNAYAAANIDTGNGDTGLPMIRAMFLEFPDEEYAYTEAGSQYQYMWGEYLLVAPVYEDNGADALGNDVRNGIYLPDEDTIWIDYFTGEQYQGGTVLNNFEAPLWKLPLFVKNGAIIPMYAEHNNPLASDTSAEAQAAEAAPENAPTEDETLTYTNNADSLDKSKRIIEFWPDGTSSFTAIEDDGLTMSNALDNSDTDYGTLENINYGNRMSTTYTSEVADGTATLTASRSTGTPYDGYSASKDTTFVVHVSAEPESVTVTNGTSELTTRVTASSKAEFDSTTPESGEYVYFYDAAPKIETYASAEEEVLAGMVENVTVAPKLYIKFANTDVTANEQKVVINGFVNDGNLPDKTVNDAIAAPVFVTPSDEDKTPTSITLNWNQVTSATGYEILVDGTINDVDQSVVSGNVHAILFNEGQQTTTFTHKDLNYHSEHTYRIRTVTANGVSKWSKALTAVSLEDPFRLTPDVTEDQVTWEGDIYNGSAFGAFDKVMQQGDSGFHSNGNSIGQALTVDYENAYVFDYIEYYTRASGDSVGGNGTVSRLRVETSLDGVNWVAHGDQTTGDGVKYYQLDTGAEMVVLQLNDPNVADSSGIGARYIRFIPLASVGNFFCVSEIKPVTIETGSGSISSPFRPGNLATQGLDTPTLALFNASYMKESSQHQSYKNASWVGEVQSMFADINFNGISDIWDYAHTAFYVDGGTTKTGSVSGDILLTPSATTISAGDTFTVDVIAVDVENLNAYGSIINYDPAKISYVSTEYIGTGSMYTQSMTGNITYTDGTAYINHNAINMGDQPLVNGSKVLATITLRANQDITLNDVTDPESDDFVIDLSTATLLGPDFSIKESKVATDVTLPSANPGGKLVAHTDIVEATARSIGSDGAGLGDSVWNSLDGSVSTYTNSNYNGQGDLTADDLAHPQVYTFTLSGEMPINRVGVQGRSPGHVASGQLSSYTVSVSLNGNDWTPVATQDVTDGSMTYAEFTAVPARYVRLELHAADGVNCVSTSEVELYRAADALPEGIEVADSTDRSVHIGYVGDVDANVLPAGYSNQYFTAVSSNPQIARIITLADENGYPIYKVVGVSAGTATITLTSAADSNVHTEYTVEVLAGPDKTDLYNAIQEAQGVEGSIYTADSYARYEEAFANAVDVYDDPDATRADVEDATTALQEAYDGLVVDPVDESLLLDVIGEGSIITESEALYSESNTADKMFDDDLSTYWESPYGGANAKLPQEIILTLDHTYMLEQISFTSHTIQNGGVTGYKISVSMDGQQWTDVTSGTVDPNAYKKGENVRVDARFVPAQAKYVKFTVTGAVGRVPAEDNMYGRIAEMDLYGTKAVEKGELYDLAQQAQDIKNDGYTEDSWNALQEAINAAFDVYDDKDATAEEIQTAYENLQTAIEGLKKEEPVDPEPTPDPVNKDALWALLEKYDGYVASDYTADSWAAFYASYQTASAVYLNEDATQDDVDAAIAALERTGAALVPASQSEDPGTTPEIDPDNEYNQTEKPADTSASMPIAPYACVTLLAAGAAFVAIRKKRTAK